MLLIAILLVVVFIYVMLPPIMGLLAIFVYSGTSLSSSIKTKELVKQYSKIIEKFNRKHMALLSKMPEVYVSSPGKDGECYDLCVHNDFLYLIEYPDESYLALYAKENENRSENIIRLYEEMEITKIPVDTIVKWYIDYSDGFHPRVVFDMRKSIRGRYSVILSAKSSVIKPVINYLEKKIPEKWLVNIKKREKEINDKTIKDFVN